MRLVQLDFMAVEVNTIHHGEIPANPEAVFRGENFLGIGADGR